MMKRILHILALAALVCCFSCTREELAERDSALRPGEEIPEGEMPVRLAYTFPLETIPHFEADTKASVVGGAENTSNDYIVGADGQGGLWMLCFDSDGIYQGYRRATLVGDPASYSHDGEACWGRELFTGTVPGNTTRIHFVGNVPGNSADPTAEGYFKSDLLPRDELVGRDEESVISTLLASYDDARGAILYWGFHKENSISSMKNWLAREVKTTTIDPDTGDEVIEISYEKSDGIVHLVRDRARVDFIAMFDYFRSGSETGYVYEAGKSPEAVQLEENQIGYQILSIDWILSNGLKNGYVAAFQNGGRDLFDGYYDVTADPHLKENPNHPTPYSYGRYDATEEAMMNVYTYDPSTGKHTLHPENSIFFFEDPNDAASSTAGRVNAPKIVLRVTYLKDRTAADAASNRTTKYHILLLQDGDDKPCKIYRNHCYKLKINGLPWRGLGYETFADALAGTDYVNNRSITIDETVPSVSDGTFDMTIEGSTYRIYQNASDIGQTKTVVFDYTVIDEADAALLNGLTGDDFEVGWTSDEIPATFASETVSVTYNPSTRKGTVSFTLGTTINNALQSGTIQLRAKGSGLTRFINVYTITRFNAKTNAGSVDLKLTATGKYRTISGTSCPEYSLTFRVPGDYPVGLYPITVRIASTTLSPMAFGADENFGVEMAPTENGDTLDGEILAGMDFNTTDPLAWNYRQANPLKSWDYWYTYSIVSKPRKMVDGNSVEDVDDKEYTIYLADTRPLRAAANRASSVGLFLKIKYFGPATPVYSAQ